MRKIETDLKNFLYYTSGDNPKLLVHTGTHGDEFEVIDIVKKTLEKYENKLPPFLFVPRVSPTAVELKSRKNKWGHNLNRDFFSNSEDPEVAANIQITKDHKFDLFVSIHEDWEFPEYYIYDWGYSKEKNKLVLKHNTYLKERGVELYSGVDDPRDVNLQHVFVEGYNKAIHKQSGSDEGFISSWILNRNLARDYLLPEIPMQATPKVKEFIVDTFFRDVVVKYFSKSRN